MKLLCAAGGTGGHVFPALAVANAALKRNPQIQILFVGTPKGMEMELVPKAGFDIEPMKIGGLKRKNIFTRIRNMLNLPGAFWKSHQLLRRFAPTAVFGIGGYVSGPLLLTASFAGFKTAIMEPNAVPGFSNRLLARFVDKVFLAFEEARSFLPHKKCVVTGNPIREKILRVSPPDFKNKTRTILVFGGSQGARTINQAVISMLPNLISDKERLFFIHQTGKNEKEFVMQAYRNNKFEADVRDFIDDMDEAFSRSDIVIARSGSSVLEIAACGRPSILVPYPFAADNHQDANAKVMEKAEAAILLSDSECTGENLFQALGKILFNEEKLRHMSAAALTLRRSNAAETIVKELLN